MVSISARFLGSITSSTTTQRNDGFDVPVGERFGNQVGDADPENAAHGVESVERRGGLTSDPPVDGVLGCADRLGEPAAGLLLPAELGSDLGGGALTQRAGCMRHNPGQ
ncbi:MAG TPA: hypothetical protein VFH80_33610 [Solirubrobacteraceae bacterium]|nr:hypothetical protein [Solirubrobacteraceae bacterium]